MIKQSVLPRRLRALRYTHGYTQVELGKRIRTSGGAISRWELGICLPNLKYILRMCLVFGCRTVDLIGYGMDEPRRREGGKRYAHSGSSKRGVIW